MGFFLSAFLFSANVQVNAQVNETLIIFLQNKPSFIQENFLKTDFSQIESMAKALKVPAEIIEVDRLVPAEVAITPLIAFQNHLGRSIYQGRTTNITRIRNFIRTARYVPQENAPLLKTDLPILDYGKAKIWSPIKIVPVGGYPPPNYDHAAFVGPAQKAIYSGFEKFRHSRKIYLGRSDRGFYMDFYPWRSEDDQLYLSLAVFSQFHCKKPIFKTGEPFSAPWSQRYELFQKAASKLEKVVLDHIKNDTGGDGFVPIPNSVETVSWDRFGLKLPESPPKATSGKGVNKEIATHWQLRHPKKKERSLVQFYFPAPLDQYRGEALRGTGSFVLKEDRYPSRAEGFVKIDTDSITMGHPDLDKVLQSSLFLDSRTYPVAEFKISTGEGPQAPFAFGRLSTVSYNGIFTLKGKSVSININVGMEPFVNEHGKVLMSAGGSFTIDLNNFNIQGPDGPEAANHFLICDVYFVLEPKSLGKK